MRRDHTHLPLKLHLLDCKLVTFLLFLHHLREQLQGERKRLQVRQYPLRIASPLGYSLYSLPWQPFAGPALLLLIEVLTAYVSVTLQIAREREREREVMWRQTECTTFSLASYCSINFFSLSTKLVGVAKLQ